MFLLLYLLVYTTRVVLKSMIGDQLDWNVYEITYCFLFIQLNANLDINMIRILLNQILLL